MPASQGQGCSIDAGTNRQEIATVAPLPRNDRVVYGLQQEKSWVLRFSDKKAIRFALSIGAVRSPR